MATSDQLDCKIFVQADATIGELAQIVTNHIGGSLSGPEFGLTITTPDCDIELHKNPDQQEITPSGEDGFLFFQYILEFYPDTDCQRKDMIDVVGKILTMIWSRGWPGVAACDYESDLPHRGGYGSTPWFSTPVAATAKG